MDTNIITAIAEATKSGAVSYLPLNVTALFSVITICIAIITIALKVFGEKTKISEESLRESQVIKDINEKLNKNITSCEKTKEDIAKDTKTQETINEQLKLELLRVNNQIELSKLQNEISNKNIEELKTSNKEVLKKLEDLVRQLYDYLSQN